MQKKILLLCSLIAIVFSMAVTVATSSNNSLKESLIPTEALAQGESGIMLVCKCSRITKQNCATNNWGANCAGGVNIRCWDYNLNCN